MEAARRSATLAPLRAAWAATLLVATAAASAQAQASAPPERPQRIDSCTGSGPAISFGLADSRVLLQEDDKRSVHAAMLQRYPMLQRDGFESGHILLWRRPGGEWVYVSLAATTGPASATCFTATFSGQAFEFTPALVQKYFYATAAPA